MIDVGRIEPSTTLATVIDEMEWRSIAEELRRQLRTMEDRCRTLELRNRMLESNRAMAFRLAAWGRSS